MFIAHDIAGWLGVPAGIVIAAMIILRRKARTLRAHRQQARVGRITAGQDSADVTASPTGGG
jgi:hypothetical protein